MENLQINDENYRKLLQNKRVAIVGPAESAFFSERGDYIDSFDVVVRVNRGIEVVKGNESFIGSYTDVLYNSLDFGPNSGGILKDVDDKIKFICCPYPTEKGTFNGAPKSIFDKFNIRFINTAVYNEMKTKTNSSLNSGFGAIIDVLQHDIQQLYITGIDFYRSLYSNKYPSQVDKMSKSFDIIERELEFKNNSNNPHYHHPDRQYAEFKRIVNTDNRVELDPFLKKIINDSRYDKWDTIPKN
tara:strand:- start:5587 stop:6315 length:729 start_codon:yes stop_codon:yes gene_type:complete